MRKGLRNRLLAGLSGKRGSQGKQLQELSTDELLGLMRHETHRIEKAVYNGILETKRELFEEKRSRIAQIHAILESRGVSDEEPTVAWSRSVHGAFENLEVEYVKKLSHPAPAYTPEGAETLLQFMKRRRSVRVWAPTQPQSVELERVTDQMLDAARWAPNSGNRQGLRFLVLRTGEEKSLLCGLKERHCVNAPLLILVGADTRLYGAFGLDERCLYLDAGAAIMQMILVAHACGLGACWNHLADDLILSRPANSEAYDRLTKTLDIPEYIAPVAVIAVGLPGFTPPTPARMSREAFVL